MELYQCGTVAAREENSDEENTGFIKPTNRRLFGITLMALAGLYLVISNTLMQMVYARSPDHVSAYSLVLARSMITTFFATIFLLVGGLNPIPSMYLIFAQTMLGVSSFGGILFIYLSLEKIPIGDATAIQCTVPIFTTFLSIAFLKQKCELVDFICCFFGIIGLVIMTRPTTLFGLQDKDSTELCETVTGTENKVLFSEDDFEYTYGVIYSLISAFMVAIFFVLIKVLGKQGDFMIGMFYVGVVGVVLPLIIALLRNIKPKFGADEKDWAIISVSSFLSYLSLMFLGEALQLEDAGPASVIRYTDFVYAFLLQYIFLGIKPTVLTVAGAIIIMFSTGTLTMYRHFTAKMKQDID